MRSCGWFQVDSGQPSPTTLTQKFWIDNPKVIISYYLILYYKYNDVLKKNLNIKTTFYKKFNLSNQMFFPNFYPYLTGKMSQNEQMPVKFQLWVSPFFGVFHYLYWTQHPHCLNVLFKCLSLKGYWCTFTLYLWWKLTPLWAISPFRN